jgi:hypothetical protein
MIMDTSIMDSSLIRKQSLHLSLKFKTRGQDIVKFADLTVALGNRRRLNFHYPPVISAIRRIKLNGLVRSFKSLSGG